MAEDTLHTWRRERLEEEVRTLRRDLEACTRDGQRLSRLLAEEEATTEALETALHALVDDSEPIAESAFDQLDGPYCLYCGGDDWDQERRDVTHKPDCPVAKARELLKGSPGCVPPPRTHRRAGDEPAATTPR